MLAVQTPIDVLRNVMQRRGAAGALNEVGVPFAGTDAEARSKPSLWCGMFPNPLRDVSEANVLAMLDAIPQGRLAKARF